MKICSICSEEKDFSEFHRNKSKKDGYAFCCKACKKVYQKSWYALNKASHILNAGDRNKKRRIENARFVYDYLKENYCVDCGEKDPLVLDFDHLFDKEENISLMVKEGWSIDKIKREMLKCEVRCANCHRRKTSQDFNTLRWQFKNMDQ